MAREKHKNKSVEAKNPSQGKTKSLIIVPSNYFFLWESFWRTVSRLRRLRKPIKVRHPREEKRITSAICRESSRSWNRGISFLSIESLSNLPLPYQPPPPSLAHCRRRRICTREVPFRQRTGQRGRDCGVSLARGAARWLLWGFPFDESACPADPNRLRSWRAAGCSAPSRAAPAPTWISFRSVQVITCPFSVEKNPVRTSRPWEISFYARDARRRAKAVGHGKF